MPVRPERVTDGRYRLRKGAGKDPVTGAYRQISRYFRAKSQAEANKLAPRIEAELQEEVERERAALGTVGYAASSWLETQHAEHKAPNTLGRLDRSVAMIVRDLGHIELSKLSVKDVEDWYTALRAENIAAPGKPPRYRQEPTVYNFHAVLRGILLTVERQTGLPAITRRVKPPKKAKPNPRPPQSAAVAELIRTAPPPLNVIAATGALLGMRRGEVLGMRWTDIQGDIVEIRRQAIDTPAGVILAPTKTTESQRRLEIPPALWQILLAWRGTLERAVAELGATLHRDAVIFPDLPVDVTGRVPLSPSKMTNTWMRHRDRAGYPHVRFHDLRHWAATVLAGTPGVSLKDVQRQLGHSTPTTTLSFYQGALDRRGGISALLAAELELEETTD